MDNFEDIHILFGNSKLYLKNIYPKGYFQIVYKIHYLDNFEDIHILFGNSKLYLKNIYPKGYFQIVYKIHYLDNFEDIHILFGNSKLYLKKHFSKKYKNPKGLFSKSFIKYTIWTTLRTSIYFLEIQNYLSKKHFSKNIKTQNGYFQIVYKIYYLDNFKDNLYTFWKFKIISQKTF